MNKQWRPTYVVEFRNTIVRFMCRIKNNTLSIIAIVLSLLALVACLVIALHSRQGHSFEETTLLISIFSIIVTILIGMQIWNIFQFERKFEFVEQKSREEIQKAKQEILDVNKTALEKTRYDAIGTVLMHLGWSFEDNKEYDDAMRAYINALRSFQRGNLNNPEVSEYFKDVVDRLLIITKELSPEDWHFVSIDEKNVFIDTVIKIPNREIMNQLLDFFYKFTVAAPAPGQMRTPSPSDE